jgi:hypothetical protein
MLDVAQLHMCTHAVATMVTGALGDIGSTNTPTLLSQPLSRHPRLVPCGHVVASDSPIWYAHSVMTSWVNVVLQFKPSTP